MKKEKVIPKKVEKARGVSFRLLNVGGRVGKKGNVFAKQEEAGKDK